MIRSRRGSAALLTALLVPLLVGAGGVPGQALASSSGDLALLALPQARGIDTSDKAAVAKAWRAHWKPHLTTKSGWTGSVRGCKAGKQSGKARAATLDSINFVRGMSGLDPVTLDAGLSRQAQKAALIMTANKALSHTPPRRWKCWTKVGAKAAGRSNLALTSGTMTAGGAIGLYMDDPGSSNIAAGHRRWILFPPADTFGSGLTKTANALYVFGPADGTFADPAWVAWPSEGWFPGSLEPGGRWSLSSGDDDTDFSHAKVRVLRGKDRLKVTTHQVADGYGQPTIVFDVSGVKAKGTYTVKVRGIRKASSASHTYKVRLFKP